MDKTIALLKGGFSNEAAVSRNSASSVEEALISLGFNVIPVEVDKTFPEWIIKNKENIDIVFNALHGNWGEDGKIQGLLEYMDIPYTHSGVTASAIGMHKQYAKDIFKSVGLKVPNSKIVNLVTMKVAQPFNRPYIIKPVSGGSSLGIKIIEQDTIIEDAIKELPNEIFIAEEYIEGKDITVAVIGEKTLGILEVSPKQRFYNYKAKYDKSSNTEYISADYLPPEIKKKLLADSIKANNILNCKGVTRVDFRLNLKMGLEGLYLLEINTQPGLTKNSLVPKIAKNAGLSFKELIKLILNDAGVNK
ncbi:MAG: D-alanine--D-alanine ligase [Rickettsiales bacterium]|nr:D-alanine--D-alanine ligase [Rickettsiales bacterium]